MNLKVLGSASQQPLTKCYIIISEDVCYNYILIPDSLLISRNFHDNI